MTHDKRADAIADGTIRIPVNEAMGFTYDSKTAEEIAFTYVVAPEHCNSAGGIQGGMLAAFADSVLGGASALHLPPEQYPALVEMKISIFRPASAGHETRPARDACSKPAGAYCSPKPRSPTRAAPLIAKASGTEIPASVPI